MLLLIMTVLMPVAVSSLFQFLLLFDLVSISSVASVVQSPDDLAARGKGC